jgi:rhamnopyranosyl-N-acetylglucosaminyl-diphospho-decaprenol beta-1,3/1,4-galactofuranosyltransferase
VKGSVAAVVVTYNRSRLLMECLDALLRQTRQVDGIVLIDNASTDDTGAMLQTKGYLKHPKIHYLRLPSNTGGAGGFYEGMKQAYEAGYEWIWVMDDDAEPSDNALELMESVFATKGIGGVANLPIGRDGRPQRQHRGWIELSGTTSSAHRAVDSAALIGNIEISFASFVGLAVHRSAVERLGLPKRELFIKGDDLEYCLRLKSIGPLILVTESKILHKDGVSSGYERRRRFGMESDRVPIDKLWLNYFSLRNLLWLRRKHCGSPVAAGFAVRQYLRFCVGILVFDSDRLIRLRFYWNAISDAWSGVFDNDKPRRLTRLGPAIAKT